MEENKQQNPKGKKGKINNLKIRDCSMPTISLFGFANYNSDLIIDFPEQFEMCVFFFTYLYKLPRNRGTMSR